MLAAVIKIRWFIVFLKICAVTNIECIVTFHNRIVINPNRPIASSAIAVIIGRARDGV